MKVLSQVRLIFTDMDETLLTDDKRITPRARAAIQALVAEGVAVVPCTGRAVEALRPTTDPLGITRMVCCNGAIVQDGPDRLVEAAMPPAVTAELAGYFRSRGIIYYLTTPKGFQVSEITPQVEQAARLRRYAPPLLAPGDEYTPAYKVSAMEAGVLYEEVEARFGKQTHVIYHPDYLEIAPVGVDKAWGARRLAQHMDVPPQQVLAFGDAMNDVELLEWAGLGVAVANALPRALEAADFITRSNNEDGVAEVLERVLRARRGGAA